MGAAVYAMRCSRRSDSVSVAREAGEPPIVTIGQDLSFLPRLVGAGRGTYSAADVVAYLMQGGKVDRDGNLDRVTD